MVPRGVNGAYSVVGGFMSRDGLQVGVIVADIRCPECERTGPVQKMALGEYRCTECDVEFTHQDVR